MNWNKLTHPSQIEQIKALSYEKPVLIFKHSTRCSISSMSLDRLLRNWKEEDKEKVEPFYLDLIAYRDLSDQIEVVFGVPHQSPQVVLIRKGEAVYDNSHFGISYPEIMAEISRS
ncbi:bacillithiol system redox-active protein YtxJ [Algoriphagus confluentis]|uniref:Bacillithiol system redox-active protein YtxJ n=1 Tax=Algoriphagus confluentis TaxID=1697556 RepID=A0ABQ6PLW5_9BACT|nr:bacillithiol system redox-active protein YtxJ [Algoriphagus confluentis]